MDFTVERITSGPKHHMFGFHDLVQTNAKGDFALALEIDDISHPPLPGESCKSGIVDLETKKFCPIHQTHTWNYPQGARQQWIGDSDMYLCNDREDDGKLVCRVVDARSCRLEQTLPFPIHCLDAVTKRAVYINYDRLHSVGAYGYVPNRSYGYLRIENLPEDDGLWIGDISSGDATLAASIREIASCGEKSSRGTGFPHYVTHPMLSPSGKRVAFLHRYRVPDGGETTRLMTIGLDGAGLRCLAKGFLSHFTWTAEDEIFIWGVHQPGICAMREAPYLRIPGVLQMSRLAKSLLKQVRRSCVRSATGTKSQAFLIIKDTDAPTIDKTAIGVIDEDGHPMARPGRLKEVVCDAYPNAAGDRQLFLFNVSSGKRADIGTFRRIFKGPDTSTFDYRLAQSGTDSRIARRFDLDHYLFARSGFHCDLHPRWSADGRFVLFDSIHEGTRQLYRVAIDL